MVDTTGGAPVCWLVEKQLAPILVGRPVREHAVLHDKMHMLTLAYGRKGLAIHAVSGVDLARGVIEVDWFLRDE